MLIGFLTETFFIFLLIFFFVNLIFKILFNKKILYNKTMLNICDKYDVYYLSLLLYYIMNLLLVKQK